MAIAIAGALLLAGCGGAHTFTADGFVDEVKGQGLAIQLGRELPSSGDADGVYTITLPPLPGEPPPAPGTEEIAGSRGSLYLYGDTGGADHEMEACRGSGLLCYQAANVVVVLEMNGLEAQRLGVAIRKLASD